LRPLACLPACLPACALPKSCSPGIDKFSNALFLSESRRMKRFPANFSRTCERADLLRRPLVPKIVYFKTKSRKMLCRVVRPAFTGSPVTVSSVDAFTLVSIQAVGFVGRLVLSFFSCSGAGSFFLHLNQIIYFGSNGWQRTRMFHLTTHACACLLSFE